jgi:hypothetical protein
VTGWALRPVNEWGAWKRIGKTPPPDKHPSIGGGAEHRTVGPFALHTSDHFLCRIPSCTKSRHSTLQVLSYNFGDNPFCIKSHLGAPVASHPLCRYSAE